MNIERVHCKLAAEHGVIWSQPDDFFGYFGWPSIARLDGGALIAAASGLRNAHVCPFGRTVICTSHDGGRTWTAPTVVNDLPIDDRDAGILSLGGDRLLLSWFTSDTRQYPIYHDYREHDDDAFVQKYEAGFARLTDRCVARWIGSWVRLSDDGGDTWGPPIRVPVTAPHGPIRQQSGRLLYLGKQYATNEHGHRVNLGAIAALASDDGGCTWSELGTVPLCDGTAEGNYHEPHAVELPDGRLVGMIRLQNHVNAPRLEDLGLVDFSLAQTESDDGGRTWTRARPLPFHGSPPHLLRHSSGAVICVYGYRLPSFGQRAMVSRDGCRSWQVDYVLRDDGPDSDLGYPASVELKDGSVLTVYYQKAGGRQEKCSLLWTRWHLPD